MIPQDILTEASRRCWQQGWRVLQGFRLAETDEAHVAQLLHWMQPEPFTHWLDIGSGFGEVARLMKEQRPDLDFTLVNNNAFQIEKTPTHLRVYDADMHALSFEDVAFDGCMFLWSLCHADDLGKALREAARVTKPGGRLFVFDFTRSDDDNALMRQHLHASAWKARRVAEAANAGGWRIVGAGQPFVDKKPFRRAMQNDALFDAIFSDVRPMMMIGRRLADG